MHVAGTTAAPGGNITRSERDVRCWNTPPHYGTRGPLHLSRCPTPIAVIGPGKLLAQILFEIADEFPAPHGHTETAFACRSACEHRAAASPLKQVPEFHFLTPCVRYQAKCFALRMDTRVLRTRTASDSLLPSHRLRAHAVRIDQVLVPALKPRLARAHHVPVTAAHTTTLRVDIWPSPVCQRLGLSNPVYVEAWRRAIPRRPKRLRLSWPGGSPPCFHEW